MTKKFILFYITFIILSGIVFSSNVSATVDLTNDVSTCYHLNENSGMIAYDSTGNNNGNLTNMENTDWISGKLNNCLQFDGINEFVNCNNVANFERNDTFSLEVWIKTTNTAISTVILGKCENFGTEKRGYMLYMYQSKIRFMLRSNTGNYLIIQGKSNINDGNWHHIIITYSGNSLPTGVKIYLDGIEDTPYNTISNSLSGTIKNTVNFQISGRNGANIVWLGNLDEIVIYNIELNNEDVLFRYNNGIGRENFGSFVYVDDNKIPSWYDSTHVKTIQEGINNISENGTIIVYAGIYNENILINKTVNLITSENAIINPNSPSSIVVYISENNVTFDGFEITQNSGSQISMGIKVNAENVLLKNLTIHNFGDELIYLSSVSGASNLIVDNCNLYDNGDYAIKSGSDGSVYSNNVLIKNCSIYDTVGTRVYKGSSWTFEYNSIHDVSNMCIGLDSGSNHIARYNRIYNFSKAGIKAEKTSEIYHNTITMDISGTNSSYYGSAIAVKYGFTGGIIKDNIITSCKKGIYVRSIPSVMTIDYNNVWGNNLNYYNCIAGANDISENPSFARLYLFSLFEDSPCLYNASDSTNIGWWQYSGIPVVPNFYFTNRLPLDNSNNISTERWLYSWCDVSNSNNDNMNIVFYMSETGINGSYISLKEFNNVSCGFYSIDLNECYPIVLNKLHYWYVFAEISAFTPYYNQSSKFNFNTTLENESGVSQTVVQTKTDVRFNTIQFIVIIQLILFSIFMWISYKIGDLIGEKKSLHHIPFSGGLFIIFGAINFISLSILLNVNYHLSVIGEFLVTIGIIILIYGILKAFYYE